MKFVQDIMIITPEMVILGWFIAYLLTHELNVSFRIKQSLSIPHTEYIKILDCAPCITWWFTLILSLEPITAAAAYLIATIIDKLES